MLYLIAICHHEDGFYTGRERQILSAVSIKTMLA
jgi:hypothetical protein